MIVSAQDLCRTRLCRTQDCENDAETYSLLCSPCQRRRRLGPAANTQPEPTLVCGNCGREKPDKAFAINARLTNRRRRHYHCKQCVHRRAIAARERQLARQRARKREVREAFKRQGLTGNGTPRVYQKATA